MCLKTSQPIYYEREEKKLEYKKGNELSMTRNNSIFLYINSIFRKGESGLLKIIWFLHTNYLAAVH